MGCNCKKKVEMIDRKYGDDGGYDGPEHNIFQKIMYGFLQFFFGIFFAAILIVMVIPMLIYLIFCIVTGKEPSFRIIDFRKKFNKG